MFQRTCLAAVAMVPRFAGTRPVLSATSEGILLNAVAVVWTSAAECPPGTRFTPQGTTDTGSLVWLWSGFIHSHLPAHYPSIPPPLITSCPLPVCSHSSEPLFHKTEIKTRPNIKNMMRIKKNDISVHMFLCIRHLCSFTEKQLKWKWILPAVVPQFVRFV